MLNNRFSYYLTSKDKESIQSFILIYPEYFHTLSLQYKDINTFNIIDSDFQICKNNTPLWIVQFKDTVDTIFYDYCKYNNFVISASYDNDDDTTLSLSLQYEFILECV